VTISGDKTANFETIAAAPERIGTDAAARVPACG
jgi:hypothetical protein